MTEVWRCHPTYPTYLVSDQGRVRGPRRLLKPTIEDGYERVAICPGQKARINKRVHILVLETFVGPCPEGQMCRHLDGIRANNILTNLAWGTQVENEADRKTHGTDNSGERSGRAKLTWAEVEEIRRAYKPRTRGVGNRMLAKKYGISANAMRLLLRGDTWRAYAL